MSQHKSQRESVHIILIIYHNNFILNTFNHAQIAISAIGILSQNFIVLVQSLKSLAFINSYENQKLNILCIKEYIMVRLT